MAQLNRPTEDAAIQNLDEADFARRLFKRYLQPHSGPQGKAPPEFVVCHLILAGWKADEIALDYGCSKDGVLRRVRQARAHYRTVHEND